VAVRGSLSQERILAAAAAIVDAEGLDALSMRRLATALGCEAMSLYKHVADKQALLDLLVERVMAEIRPPDPQDPWDRRLLHVALELRRVGLAHPQLFLRLTARLPATPAALEPVEAALAALRDAGFDERACTSQFWAVVAYTTGAIIGEIGATTGAGAFPYAEAELDPARFPTLHALGPALAACDWAEEYERGLAALLATPPGPT
jgi:AcrR family transcriptional regulator